MSDLDSLTLDPKRVRMFAIVLFVSAIMSFIGAVHLFTIREPNNTVHTAIVAGELIFGFLFLVVSYLFRGVANRLENRNTEQDSSEKPSTKTTEEADEPDASDEEAH